MKYPYFVYQSKADEHLFWVAKSATLNGCLGQGDTQEEAIAELAENETEWLITAQGCGIPIPPVPGVHLN